MTRHTEYDKLDPMFIERWSPRSLRSDPIPEEDLMTLIEAARWSPSCFNDQPAYFGVANTPEDLALYQNCLMEKNNLWAQKAPVLLALFTRKHFGHNGSENALASFDAGAAWMSLALQAHKLGYVTHAMAGFSADKLYKATGVDPERYAAQCMIAVGKQGPLSALPEALQEREKPNRRQDIRDVFFKGSHGDHG